MAKSKRQQLDDLYEQCAEADLAYHEARVKELKARKTCHAAERQADAARKKVEELHDRLRDLQLAGDSAPEGGAE